MQFCLSAEEQLLRQTARRWAAEHYGDDATADLLAGRPVSVDERWRAAVEFGWPVITVPAEHGGAGGGVVDACLVVEALAERFATIPLAGNVIAATALHLLGGDAARDAVAELADGRARFALVLDRELRWPPVGGDGCAFDWLPGDRLLGLGPGGLVELATSGGGPGTAPTVGVEPVTGQDPVRSLGLVTAGGSAGPAADEPPDGPAALVLATALTVTSALLVGVMQGALSMAVRHAGDRRQYGRPIGSFQAVRHLCADMAVDLEGARSAVYGAACAVDGGEPRRALRAAATAKAWTAPASVRVVESAIQVLGGLGITWEVPAHLYLREAHLLSRTFRDADAALDLVAATAAAEPVGARA